MFLYSQFQTETTQTSTNLKKFQQMEINLEKISKKFNKNLEKI